MQNNLSLCLFHEGIRGILTAHSFFTLVTVTEHASFNARTSCSAQFATSCLLTNNYLNVSLFLSFCDLISELVCCWKPLMYKLIFTRKEKANIVDFLPVWINVILGSTMPKYAQTVTYNTWSMLTGGFNPLIGTNCLWYCIVWYPTSFDYMFVTFFKF